MATIDHPTDFSQIASRHGQSLSVDPTERREKLGQSQHEATFLGGRRRLTQTEPEARKSGKQEKGERHTLAREAKYITTHQN